MDCTPEDTTMNKASVQQRLDHQDAKLGKAIDIVVVSQKKMEQELDKFTAYLKLPWYKRIVTRMPR